MLRGALHFLIWVTGAPGSCSVHRLHIQPELPDIPLNVPTTLPSGSSLSPSHLLTFVLTAPWPSERTSWSLTAS